ncbi:GntR family transcriptional regulator [Spongiactinospora sp. TRM90649]|uniref:GntR family transcriptional regulator n=1 Tax=Spongiactinospora sp. TRM90649 TaxID=3031114 RepID=UPI0023F892D5|nr:GntR family transcriptional regulator [Spongiactinospora sp. TRM90649]MDF5758772.1 GntR family transcriptional regulator [Spongiactinospora sp. TRM90649]
MRPDTRHPSHKVAADLRAKIMAGLLKPDEQLPSTPQLAERYDAAPTTIQNAVRMLKAEGFVTSRAGAGVYVSRDHAFTVETAAYYDPASRGVAYRILDVAELQPPADVAAALKEDRAVCRSRLTMRGETPMELSRSYYPMSLAAGTPLTGRGRIRGGAPAVLADLGYPELEWTDRVSTRVPTTEEAEILEIPDGVPVLRQFRTIFSEDDRPVEVSVLIKPGHLYELTYRQAVDDEQ